MTYNWPSRLGIIKIRSKYDARIMQIGNTIASWPFYLRSTELSLDKPALVKQSNCNPQRVCIMYNR